MHTYSKFVSGCNIDMHMYTDRVHISAAPPTPHLGHPSPGVAPRTPLAMGWPFGQQEIGNRR